MTSHAPVTKSVEVRVEYPRISMTLSQVDECDALLAEIGAVEVERGGGRLARYTVRDIASTVGDVGPDDWALEAVGLHRDDIYARGDAAAVFNAQALIEWWAPLRDALRDYGAEVPDEPEIVALSTSRGTGGGDVQD